MRILITLGALTVTTTVFLTAATAAASPANDVSEIAGYTRIYQLDIPNDAAFDTNAVPYGFDASSAEFPGGITRIAYYLELDDGTGRKWIWVSMDAFTQDLTKIGVPSQASGAMWQMTVDNMDVESNVADIVTGTDITTGNIEFWPYNYGKTASLPNIGGSSLLYDFNDLNELSNNYGSMQIHNYGAGQTLLAYNGWGGNPTYPVDDVGVGNNSSGAQPDWTFQRNAASFSLKSLEVWVRPVPPVPALGPVPLTLLALALAALGSTGVSRLAAGPRWIGTRKGLPSPIDSSSASRITLGDPWPGEFEARDRDR